MQVLERRFEVERPLLAVWDALARVEEWPRWARHIRSIRLSPPGDLGPRTSGAIRLRNGISSRFTMTRLVPGESWEWSGKFLWLTVLYDHAFAARGPERTEVAFRIDVQGALAGSLGRVFAAIYARSLDRAIPNLIAQLESGAPARPQA